MREIALGALDFLCGGLFGFGVAGSLFMWRAEKWRAALLAARQNLGGGITVDRRRVQR